MLCAHVLDQIDLCTGLKVTVFTCKGPLPRVFLHVLPKVPFAFTSMLTVGTFEDSRFATCMCSGPVKLQFGT